MANEDPVEDYVIGEGLLTLIGPNLSQFAAGHGYILTNPEKENPMRILVKRGDLIRQIELLPSRTRLDVLAVAYYEEGNTRYHRAESVGQLSVPLNIASLVETLERANGLASRWNKEDLTPYQKQN